MTGETYSRHHYPRADHSNPQTNIAFYLLDETRSFVGEYGFSDEASFATIGSLDKEMPAGNYVVYISNVNNQVFSPAVSKAAWLA